MKNLFVIIMVLSAVGCTKEISRLDSPPVVSPVVAYTAPVAAEFVGAPTNDPRLQGATINFENAELNQPVDVIEAFGCNGYLFGSTNAVVDTGIPDGSVVIESTDEGRSGIMRFGHLPYVHPSESSLSFAAMTMKNDVCLIFAKESFNFQVDAAGNLTLFAIAPGKSWDGSASVFLKQ